MFVVRDGFPFEVVELLMCSFQKGFTRLHSAGEAVIMQHQIPLSKVTGH